MKKSGFPLYAGFLQIRSQIMAKIIDVWVAKTSVGTDEKHEITK